MSIERLPLLATALVPVPAVREAGAYLMGRARHGVETGFAAGTDLRAIRPMENLMTLLLTRLAAATFGLLAALLKR